MQRYDSLFPLLPDHVAQYTIGGERLPKVAIATKWPLGLREKIFAALVSHALGIGSSYAERRYAAEFNQTRWLGMTDRIDSIFEEALKLLNSHFALRQALLKQDDRSFAELANQFFYRNLGSLDAAKRLSEQGYLCEVATILRSSLEQFAYSSKLASLSGSEDLAAIRPTKCINHFKEYVPAAGRLYGLMSKYTHFEFDHHTHFFAYSPNEVQTIQRASVLRAYSTHLLFAVLVCVAKYVLASSESLVLKTPNRFEGIEKVVERIDAYSDDVCSILKLDTVLAEMDILLHEIAVTSPAMPT